MTATEPVDVSAAVLGSWPTPLEPAPRLARAIGLDVGDLWVKRDDLTGLGGGGNKVRKLEWLCGAALARGADTLVTCGARQSNHARLTAAAGARLGLRVVLVLAGSARVTPATATSRSTVCWARRWCGPATSPTRLLSPSASDVVDQLRQKGARPELIPYGGSSVLGARGYVVCGRELLHQAPDLTTVVTALGSGGTMAGLVHALGAGRVLGVDCGAVEQPAETVARLVGGLAGAAPDPAALRLRLDHVGAGYAVLTEPVMAALTLAARAEGLILDPIYTGRALAGLMSAVAEDEIKTGERTVLLHSGGLPGLFGHPGALARSVGSLMGFS